MTKENIEQNLDCQNLNKKTTETRKSFPKEIRQKELTSKKHKKVCNILNYIELLLILTYGIT